MDDLLIQAIGRTLIELSAQKEEFLQAFKKSQETIKQVQSSLVDTAVDTTVETLKEN